jgi:hypothetical protein
MNITKWNGRMIETPGLYRMPLEKYHTQCCIGPSVSSSGLRTIENDCPAEYWAFSSMNPYAYEKKKSHALNFGSAAHCLILGDESFDERYALRPSKWSDWRKKEAQEWRAEQEAAGLIVVTPEDLDHIAKMAKVLAKHPLNAAGLFDGEAEVSMIWQDVTGIWLKARPDILPPSGDVADFKTCASAEPRDCLRDVTKMGYHMQMALCMEGMRQFGMDPQAALLLFVQKTPPYYCTPIEIDEDALYWAAALNRRAIDTFARCYETGEWPDYTNGDIKTYSIPEYVHQLLSEQQAAGELPNLEDGN